MDSPELDSLNKCYPTLISCIQLAPSNIAVHLRPLGLLPEKVLVLLRNSQKNDDEKAQEIVEAVLFQVKKDSSVFYSFIEALKTAGPWTNSTVNELQKEFNSYSVRSSTTDNAASTCEQSQQPTPLQHTSTELPINTASTCEQSQQPTPLQHTSTELPINTASTCEQPQQPTPLQHTSTELPINTASTCEQSQRHGPTPLQNTELPTNTASTCEQSRQPTPLQHTELPTNVVTGSSLSSDNRTAAPHSHLQGIHIAICLNIFIA